MNVATIYSSAGTGFGNNIPISDIMGNGLIPPSKNAGKLAIQITGSSATAYSGTVKLQGRISNASSAGSNSASGGTWSYISGATFTTDTIEAIDIVSSHIRVHCLGNSGYINVKTLL